MKVKYNDEYWMRQALQAAKQSEQIDEVPIGAVIVCENKLLACTSNKPISVCDPCAHAEILAIRDAARQQNNYRLTNATIYVTLEPCMMCAGAMLHARIERLVFGAYDFKTGVVGGCFDWLVHEKQQHKIQVQGGVLEEECSAVLKDFFAKKRSLTK